MGLEEENDRSELDHSGNMFFVKKKRGVVCLLLVWPLMLAHVTTPLIPPPHSLSHRRTPLHMSAGDPKHLESSWVLIENGGQVTLVTCRE